MEPVKSIDGKKKVLLLRAGGMGDILILTAVAKQLWKLNYSVHFYCGSPTGRVDKLLNGLPFLDSVKQLQRLRGVDCIEDEQKNFVSVEMLKKNFDVIVDYKLSIEDNRVGGNEIKEAWELSRNSNFQNWIDLSLAWAKIDPNLVLDKDKCPEVAFDANKPEWLEIIEWIITNTPIGVKDGRPFRVFGIQLQASSLIRTWYKAPELPDLIYKEYPNDIVLVFTNGSWVMMSKFGNQKITAPEKFDPLMFSACIIRLMDVFISADSGTSHLAEALGTKSIVIYTTVPAWTRVKYYQNCYPLEANSWCHPCFALDLFCPEEKKKAEATLSEREKKIVEASNANKNIQEVARELSTVPQAIKNEYDAAMKRVEALSAQEALCVKSITPAAIMNKLDEILNL